jgi:hypothetical protein
VRNGRFSPLINACEPGSKTGNIHAPFLFVGHDRESDQAKREKRSSRFNSRRLHHFEESAEKSSALRTTDLVSA